MLRKLIENIIFIFQNKFNAKIIFILIPKYQSKKVEKYYIICNIS